MKVCIYLAFLSIITCCATNKKNYQIRYLVVYEGREYSTSNMYGINVAFGLDKKINLDGGYTLKISGDATNISTILVDANGKERQFMNQSPENYNRGNLYLICEEDDSIKRVTPIPHDIPSCGVALATKQ